MNIAHVAWCAGLIDGEGCIGAYPTSAGRFRAVVRVTMTDLEPLNELWVRLRVGTIHNKTVRPPRRPAWCYCISDQGDAEAALRMLLPFLVVKRRQAELALQLLEQRGENAIALAYEIGRLKRPGVRDHKVTDFHRPSLV